MPWSGESQLAGATASPAEGTGGSPTRTCRVLVTRDFRVAIRTQSRLIEKGDARVLPLFARGF